MKSIYNAPSVFEAEEKEVSAVTKAMLRSLCEKMRERYPDEVKGLWYINERDWDGSMQFVIECTAAREEYMHRNKIAAFISVSIDFMTYGPVGCVDFADNFNGRRFLSKGLLYRIY